MSEIVRYVQHKQQLEAVNRQSRLSAERVAAKGALTRQAVGQAMMTALAVEEAARIAPSGIAEYGMLAAFGAQALVEEIVRF